MSAVEDARAKERRQKIIAAVGGAVLVVLLLMQGPKLVTRLGGDAAAAPPTTEEVSPAAAEPQSSPTTPAGSSLAAVLVAERRVVRSPGRLYAFNRFPYKDPFAEPGDRGQRQSTRTRTAAPPTKRSRRTARRVRFTVIVHSLPVALGRKRAQAIAREVSIRLGRRARVLRSSTQRSLLPGYWVVHVGSYRSRSAAAPALRAARRVNRRAYIRHIRL